MSYGWQRRSGPSFGLIVVIALGLLGGLAAAGLFASPRVSGRSPAAGAAGISALSPVVVTFSQPIQPDTALSRVTLSPPTEGELVAGEDGRTVQFIPRQAWPNGTTVTVAVASGTRSRLGLPMLVADTWQFTVGESRVAYLTDSSGLANVWALQPGLPAAQITASPGGVLDFAISPDGTQLVYAAMRANGGSDLRTIGVDGTGDAALLECPSDICRAPRWSPDGRWLAFERWPMLNIAADQSPARESRVWLMNLAAGEAEQLEPFGDTTLEPRWSPDSASLAYYDLSAEQIIVYDVAAGTLNRLANTSGEMGAWTPDGLALVFPEIVFAGEAPPSATSTLPTATPAAVPAPADQVGFYSHLVRVEVESRTRHELSNEPLVEDAAAMPAPDNSWIAFGRKFLDADRWTPGRQLWLMRPDGSDPHALTSDGDYQHSAFAWSPDGQQLVYIRYNLATPGAPPELWLINVDGTNPQQLATGAYIPLWLP